MGETMHGGNQEAPEAHTSVRLEAFDRNHSGPAPRRRLFACCGPLLCLPSAASSPASTSSPASARGPASAHLEAAVLKLQRHGPQPQRMAHGGVHLERLQRRHLLLVAGLPRTAQGMARATGRRLQTAPEVVDRDIHTGKRMGEWA